MPHPELSRIVGNNSNRPIHGKTPYTHPWLKPRSLRKRYAIKLRVYDAGSANGLPHKDSNNKLIAYRFVFHGCTRLVIYVKFTTDNKAAAVANFFRNGQGKFDCWSQCTQPAKTVGQSEQGCVQFGLLLAVWSSASKICLKRLARQFKKSQDLRGKKFDQREDNSYCVESFFGCGSPSTDTTINIVLPESQITFPNENLREMYRICDHARNEDADLDIFGIAKYVQALEYIEMFFDSVAVYFPSTPNPFSNKGGPVGQQRMFPYNTTQFLRNSDDSYGIMGINPGILVGNITYTKITVSVNGLIYLGMRYMTDDYTPNMLSGYEVMAPYWSDIDMRGSSGGIAYSQHRNSHTDSFSQTIINETSSYISARTSVNFSPTLVILVTWIKGFPFPSSSYVNTNETTTFQLNLATNNHSTYASFIYEDGAMLWKYTSETPHVGFSLNKNILDLVLGETGIYPSYRFDTVVGNTGRMGEWLFDVINFPPIILSPRHLILSYGEVNNFQIKATSPTALALTYSINGTGISATMNSTNGNVSLHVNSPKVTMTFIVKDANNQTSKFQPKITLCNCVNGNANKFSAAHGIGVGLGVAVLIVIGFAVADIYKHRKQSQSDITKDVKAISNESYEMGV
eukprot:gene11758-12977_t